MVEHASQKLLQSSLHGLPPGIPQRLWDSAMLAIIPLFSMDILMTGYRALVFLGCRALCLGYQYPSHFGGWGASKRGFWLKAELPAGSCKGKDYGFVKQVPLPRVPLSDR